MRIREVVFHNLLSPLHGLPLLDKRLLLIHVVPGVAVAPLTVVAEVDLAAVHPRILGEGILIGIPITILIQFRTYRRQLTFSL